ncbi:NAD(P)-dependent oxidoreductase [Paenibacillus sp. GCM10027626]|uniref:NAD(P)-dependent oxidoreductase n=1 Tax=Paenibacillus sp. GCM10027626 TaxID=3273411 RepID=UPI00364057E7
MKILITAPYSVQAREMLKPYAEIEYRDWKDKGTVSQPDEVIQLLKETGADALITEHDRVDDSVLKAVDLKFVGVCRGTPSNVDLEAANRHGVPIFHTPARNAQAVAELVIGKLIVMLRNVQAANAWLKSGQWTEGAYDSYLQFRGNELAGKTVGMVGFGAVAQTTARLLKVFPCPIQYYDPYLSESPDSHFVAMNSIEELMATSDIVSIHLPANKHTEGMITLDMLARMKKDALFVNSSRASVVDQNALYTVLKERKIAGAILDVFYSEPPGELDNEMIRMPHVLATPHIAGATHEVDNHHTDIMNRALIQWFNDPAARVKELVNPQFVQQKQS